MIWFIWFDVFFSFYACVLFHHRFLILLSAFDEQMWAFYSIYYGFVDGASRYTHNLASVSWVVYSPTNELLSLGRIYLGHTTNNVAEYHVVIGLLTEAIYLSITQFIVNLDSQLEVFELNRIYNINDPILYQLYLRVCFLENLIEFIQYQHILMEFNLVSDSLENYILDWHLAHICQSKY